MVEKWSELTKLGMKGPLCKKNIRRGRFSAIDCPWKKEFCDYFEKKKQLCNFPDLSRRAFQR